MRPLLAAAALLLSATCGLAYKADVDGWAIGNVATTDPVFVGCVMSRSYQDQTRLSILVSTQYEWAIGAANETWNMQKAAITDFAVHIDGKFVASGKATSLDEKAIVLPISGAGPYRALQAGKRLALQTPYANLSYLLVGTGNAMIAILDCVKTLQPQQIIQKPPSPAEAAQVVPLAEAMASLVNIFNAAGIVGYRIDPPQQDATSVLFGLADGTRGLFRAMRGLGTANADEYAGYIIRQLTDICQGGQFFAGKESVPSTDGAVIRKVVSTCRAVSGDATVTEISIVRRASGFLTELTQIIPASSAKRDELNRASLVDAALHMQDAR